ncbi:formin-like protein 14 [Camarhynchus parvulus]|uniref:formin-like protein 14 n=1 Tax=Geospiza parvula TaxID=87175 RepID=UPI001237E05D|nr:formin-like protein 14 [Camarhynchus parvulus]
MPDQGFDPDRHMNATSSHMQPAPEMPSKIFTPACPLFPTRGKRQWSHCGRERNMGLPPLFPRPPVIENIRERGGAGRAAHRSPPGPAPQPRGTRQAAAPQRDAPPPPPSQPRRTPRHTQARAGPGPQGEGRNTQVPGRTGGRSARRRQCAAPDPPRDAHLPSDAHPPPGPPGPPPPGAAGSAAAVSPWEPGTPRRPLCSHLGTAWGSGSRARRAPKLIGQDVADIRRVFFEAVDRPQHRRAKAHDTGPATARCQRLPTAAGAERSSQHSSLAGRLRPPERADRRPLGFPPTPVENSRLFPETRCCRRRHDAAVTRAGRADGGGAVRPLAGRGRAACPPPRVRPPARRCRGRCGASARETGESAPLLPPG